MNIIEFEQDIPFSQKVNIEGKIFEFDFYWRKADDSILLDLKDDNNKLIVKGEEIRYGMPLFYRMCPDVNGNIRQDLPQKLIVPLTQNMKYERVGIETLFKTVFLTLQDVDIAITRTSEK